MSQDSKKTVRSVMGERAILADPAIIVDDVGLKFGEVEVLKSVSFKIRRGQLLAILGLSGSGKSTLLKCILGLLNPTSGKVLVNGKNVADLKERELNHLRKRMGIAFQYSALFDSMTIFENVCFGLREHTELSEEEIAKIVREKLEIVDIEKTEQMLPSELSGGMKKRVSFARAIATDPDIILYDEPTSGLDPIMSTVINQLIRKLQDQLQATQVMVTHDLKGAVLADQIVFLHEGVVAWEGTSEEFQNSTEPLVVQLREGSVEGPIKVLEEE